MTVDAREASPHPRAPVWAAVTLVALVAGAAAVVSTGPVGQMRYGNDVFVVIEGAWRVLQGQRPHVDFNSSLGLGMFVIVAAGFKVFGMTVAALPKLLAALGLCAGVWCWLVAAPRTRAQPWLAAALSTMTGYFTFASFLLDEAVAGVSYVGAYNHVGHSLLVVLAADVILRREGPERRGSELLLGCSSGLLCAGFALTKQTFLLPCTALLALAATRLPRGRWWWGGAGLGAASLLAAATVYLRGDLLAVARDFLFVARARAGTVGTTNALPFWLRTDRRMLDVDAAKLFEVLRIEGSTIAALSLGVMVALWPLAGVARAPARREDRTLILVTSALFLTSLAVLLTSWQWAHLPSAALLGVYVAREAAHRASTTRDPLGAGAASLRVVVATALALALCAALTGRSALAMKLARVERRLPQNPAAIIDAPAYRGMTVWNAGYCEPETFGARITEGLAVLRGARDPRGRILVLDFVNPFSFALRRPSPRGDAVSWSLTASFTERVHLPARKVFAEVDLVMVPRCPLEAVTTAAMSRIYRDSLEREFSREAETRYWVLLSRRRGRAP